MKSADSGDCRQRDSFLGDVSRRLRFEEEIWQPQRTAGDVHVLCRLTRFGRRSQISEKSRGCFAPAYMIHYPNRICGQGGGGGVLPIMAYTGRLRPKGVPF